MSTLPRITACLALFALLLTSSACGSSKASQNTEEVDPSESPETQPASTQTLEQSVVVDDELAAVEQKAPADRTLRDDLVIVCHAPDKFAGQDIAEEEKLGLMTTYISENIYTPEAIQLFNDMSVMSLQERQSFFEEQVMELGIESCPMALYINPSAPASEPPAEEQSEQEESP